MLSTKEKLHEINNLADKYGMYLYLKDKPEEKVNDCCLALKALVWQAGEQMEFLKEHEKYGIPGKQFTMMIGFAYSIIENLEHVADMADIYNHQEGDKKCIFSDTHYISGKRTYGDRNESEITDHEYFTFLRSFLCAHPMDTNRSKTVSDFLPNVRAFCKFVNFDVNPLFRSRSVPVEADYHVQVLSNCDMDLDFYIVSKEVWQFIDDRYEQLVNVLYEYIIKRIHESENILKNKQITYIGDIPDNNILDKLVVDDKHRCGNYTYALYQIRLFLSSLKISSVSREQKSLLKTWAWNCVKEISEDIQNLDNRFYGFSTFINKELRNIGCNPDQIGNFTELSPFYDIDFDSNGCVINDNGSSSSSVDDEKLIDEFYESIKLDFDSLKKKELDMRNDLMLRLLANEDFRKESVELHIDYITHLYCLPANIPREDIARLYFVAVLPEFVESYDLMDTLTKQNKFRILFKVLASAIDWNAKNEPRIIDYVSDRR